jgi:hypothetical protein
MKLVLIGSLVVASAAIFAQTAKAESPVPCKPGYVRSPQTGGPCRLNVLPANIGKTVRTQAAPRRMPR